MDTREHYVRRTRLMTLNVVANQARSLYVATQDISRCVGSILLRINASLEYISDYLYIQQNPSRDAGISCSLPGWQIEQRLCHINYILYNHLYILSEALPLAIYFQHSGGA